MKGLILLCLGACLIIYSFHSDIHPYDYMCAFVGGVLVGISFTIDT